MSESLVDVVYVGPHPEVEVPAASLIVKKGETVSVASELAKGLLIQTDIWQKAGVKPAKRKE